MTIQTPLRFLAGSVFALSLIVYGAPWSASQVALAQEQSLFVAYTDIEGAPVTDMEARNIIIQWDDEACEIVELEPIDWPVQVTVTVDTATQSAPYFTDLREGLQLFVDELAPGIEVAIMSIGGRPQFLTEPTSDREAIRDAIGSVSTFPLS